MSGSVKVPEEPQEKQYISPPELEDRPMSIGPGVQVGWGTDVRQWRRTEITEKQRVPTVTGVESIRRMRGCSQSQLLRCSDGKYYVVKFPNNPLGARILVNELLGTLLARKLGLPVPEPALVSVPYELIRHSQDMVIQLDHGHIPCRAGLCFGSRFPRDENLHPQLAQPIEFVPSKLATKVDNISDFAGMLVFDKWTGNADDRQIALVRRSVGGSYRVLMIDQGFCFGGPRWEFGVGAKYGVYVLTPSVYSKVERLSDFDPWLERLESQVDRSFLEWAARQIPPGWHQNDHRSVARLIDTLDARRSRVTELLLSTRDAYPALFPAWVRPA